MKNRCPLCHKEAPLVMDGKKPALFQYCSYCKGHFDMNGNGVQEEKGDS